MTLHEICLNTLNHEITQALACSKRFEKSFFSNELAILGLLHFFVVSGAHLNTIISFTNQLKIFKDKVWLTQSLLFTFVAMCAYSPPVLRVFLYFLLKTSVKNYGIYIPTLATHFFSYVFCLSIFSSSQSLIFSTNLSYTFCFIVFLAQSSSYRTFALKLYVLSLPFFLFVFGVPHLSTLVITPITAVYLTFILLPFSLLSLFYFRTESIVIESWWVFQDFINFVTVFFNFPRKYQIEYSFISSWSFICYNLLNFILLSTGVIIWRRNSYSFV